jgi:lysophospholipase L1-like esterase
LFRQAGLDSNGFLQQFAFMFSLRVFCLIAFLFYGTGMASAMINVACIGDSITSGVGVNNPATESYPAKLQKLLGTNYDVLNYGVSGTTALIQGDMPYVETSAYTASHNPPLPNIVIIMLGSNDSKPQNWQNGTNEANFISSYGVLIRVYTNLSSLPRVLLCTPPPCFGSNTPDINPGIVATNISPLIRQFGTNNNLQVIDMQLLLAGHGEWFPDNVHPNSPGTSVMAAIVYTAILGDTLNGAIPNVGINALTNNNVVLNWPAGGAGWVVQTIPILNATNNWLIVSNSIVNAVTSTVLTNPVAGPSAMFRLWNPSIQNN